MKLYIVCVLPACHEKRLRPHRMIRAFTDLAQAERYRDALNRGRAQPPDGVNPFFVFWAWWTSDGRLGGGPATEGMVLAKITSFPDEILCDWVLDCGLSPPERLTHDPGNPRSPWCLTFRDWYGWWQANLLRMDDYQRRKVCEALDKLDLFEIVETELEP